jgi:release factor glutamine methyltransferase
MSSVRDACLSGFFRGYYRYTAFLNRMIAEPRINGIPFVIAPSVCRPLGNEQVVAEYIPTGKTVLEIGCGSGIITFYAALKSAHVTAVDISPDAIENTKLNMTRLGVKNVDVVLGDAFDCVTGTFDVVMSNPPWVDFELDDPNRKWASSATLIPQLFKKSGDFLIDGGLLAISCPAAAKETLVRLADENGFDLIATHPREKRSDLKIRLLTLVYLQVGFHPLVYLFRKRGAAA